VTKYHLLALELMELTAAYMISGIRCEGGFLLSSVNIITSANDIVNKIKKILDRLAKDML
jgi:hypothetical protein